MSDRTVSRLILIAALAIGLFLRLWQINQLGYNTDEAVYAGQAAAIAQDPVLKNIFPVFRAHPLLFQFVMALVFQFGVVDVWGRLAAVVFGIATIVVVYQLGKVLYGPRAGALAALFIAVMPYQVVVNRQVLLDGPMAFFAVLTLYLLARFALTERPFWLYATGAAMGLTFLGKETSIILLGAIYAFLALSREIHVRIRDLVISMIIMVIVIAPFPLSIALGGGSRSGQQYLTWQLFRQANHEWYFYPLTVPPVIGPLIIIAALAGLWLLRHERSWRERLLISWIVVPIVFFQLWPTKGFQYLLPIACPLAVLAARTLSRWAPSRDVTLLRRHLSGKAMMGWATGLVAVSLLIPSWQSIQLPTTGTFLAGTGGVPGGREAGQWVRENTPLGSQLMTIGPSMANIIEFYGHRKAYGLAVNPNPLRRNPSYEPLLNADLQLRDGDLQYVVWDSFSASRSTFFSDGVLRYAQRYNGRVVHTESVPVTQSDGTIVSKPVIVIYEVRP